MNTDYDADRLNRKLPKLDVPALPRHPEDFNVDPKVDLNKGRPLNAVARITHQGEQHFIFKVGSPEYEGRESTPTEAINSFLSKSVQRRLASQLTAAAVAATQANPGD